MLLAFLMLADLHPAMHTIILVTPVARNLRLTEQADKGKEERLARPG